VPKKASSDTTEFKAMLTAVRETTSVEGGQEEGRRSPPATAHIVGERARWSGAEESRRSPLFLDDSVVVGGCRGVSVDMSESICALHQLGKFVVVAGDPLAPKRASQG
jgi:hypothetical protein